MLWAAALPLKAKRCEVKHSRAKQSKAKQPTYIIVTYGVVPPVLLIAKEAPEGVREAFVGS